MVGDLMDRNWKSVIAAFVAAFISTLVGVLFFFAPIAQADKVTGPLLPPVVSLLVYVILSIALFDWIAQQICRANKAALIVAVSLFIHVNVDIVLRASVG